MTTKPSEAAAFARIFWMMIGPMLMFLFVGNIVLNGNGWLTFADVAFLTLLGGVALARYVEFRAGQAQTATGEPATAAHVQRYILITLAVGAGVWVFANLLGNHWLAG